MAFVSLPDTCPDCSASFNTEQVFQLQPGHLFVPLSSEEGRELFFRRLSLLTCLTELDVHWKQSDDAALLEGVRLSSLSVLTLTSSAPLPQRLGLLDSFCNLKELTIAIDFSRNTHDVWCSSALKKLRILCIRVELDLWAPKAPWDFSALPSLWSLDLSVGFRALPPLGSSGISSATNLRKLSLEYEEKPREPPALSALLPTSLRELTLSDTLESLLDDPTFPASVPRLRQLSVQGLQWKVCGLKPNSLFAIMRKLTSLRCLKLDLDAPRLAVLHREHPSMCALHLRLPGLGNSLSPELEAILQNPFISTYTKTAAIEHRPELLQRRRTLLLLVLDYARKRKLSSSKKEQTKNCLSLLPMDLFLMVLQLVGYREWRLGKKQLHVIVEKAISPLF